jgi:tape measure domain-containing protein
MDNQPLEVKIDSKGARADLAALAKSLDQATASVGKMQSGFTTGMAGVSQSLNTSMKSMEKFAQVAGVISKIKLSGDPATHVRQFAQAMNTLSRAKAIDAAQITSIKTLSTTLRELKVPNQAQRLTQFLNAVGAAKAPSASSIARINDLLKALSKFQGSAAIRNVRSLQNFFSTIANLKVPSAASIGRLEQMFKVLQGAKSIPGAQKIAADLDHIAGAASRAGTALNTMPARMRSIGPTFAAAEKSAGSLHSRLKESEGHAGRATRAYLSVGAGLDGLSSRFRLSYQAGTLFSAFFSAFTVGQFLKGLYDSNIQLLKLQKALLFTTGSFDGAEKATDKYISMADNLGLSLSKTTEAYSRFTISAKATGIDLNASNKIFGSVATALQVVGANSNQTELAFYGLTQMMQKGKVVSEEFNRQIGEQIPGNAVIGAQALSKLEGRFVSVAEFFQRMQKGLILSKEFVPAYAEALNTAYSPLIEIAKRRPDVALNRVRNAFQVFAREVGRGGFLSALGTEFDKLHNKIVVTDKDGVEHLTPAAQKLADTLGKNLANMVHVLGKALEFAAENIDSIIAALKGLLALKVGAAFFDWGQKAAGFAGALIPVKKAATEVAVATAASGAASAAGGGAAVLPLALRKGGFFRRRKASTLATELATAATGTFATFNGTGAITEGGTSAVLAESAAARAALHPNGFFSRPGGIAGNKGHAYFDLLGGMGAVAPNISQRGVNLEEAAKSGAGVKGLGKLAAEGAIESEKAGVRAASAFAKFGGVLGKVAPLLGLGVVGALAAATVALVAFGDHTTTVGGKAVHFNDIVAGGFQVVGDRIGKWWENSGSKLSLFGLSLGSLGKNSGEIVAHMVAGFITLGQIIGDVIGAIGKSIYDLVIGPFAKLFSVMKKLLSGDFKGAGQEVADYVLSGGAAGAVVRDVSHGVMNVGRDIAGGAQTKQDVINAAQQAASDRANGANGDAAQQAANQQAEAALQAADAARQAAQDQGELEALQRRAALGDLGQPKIEELLTKAQAAWDKTATATDATAQATAATAQNTKAGAVTAGGTGVPAAPADIAQAILGAAKSQGVDANLLTRIAFKESSFNPKRARRTRTATTSAPPAASSSSTTRPPPNMA